MVHRLATCLRVAALVLPSALDAHTAAEANGRLVSMADLHGEYQHAIKIMQAAGLIEEGTNTSLQGPDGRPFSQYKGVRWIGGTTTLVQTGDIVDRGEYARDLYALFQDLRQQAASAGGRVVNLVGNHELMNIQRDLRYVSDEDYAEFGGVDARKEAFAPDGWVGRQIMDEFQVAFMANETIFVHAGLLPEHLARGIDWLNGEFRRQLHRCASSRCQGKEFPLLQATGPVWLRRLATGKEAQACPELKKALTMAGARRLVVGHTQVADGSVRPRCGGHLLMADTIIGKSGYPECYQTWSMTRSGCRGTLSYVEVRGHEAVAVQVPEPGAQETKVHESQMPTIEL